MKALVLRAPKQRPTLSEHPEPVAGSQEVIVDLLAAALNRRDLYITLGQYPGVRTPVVLGSDGVGILDGQRVILQPGLHWGNTEAYQSADYTILGTPADGTFAERIAVPEANVRSCPGHLSDAEAAALPLAGLTAYRALKTRGAAATGETVLVTGAGGGVAGLAIQFATALGCCVFATSSRDEKLAFAKTLGAANGVCYTDPEWIDQLRALTGGIDVVIDGAGGEGFSQLIPLMKAGGRMVFYGGTRGKFAPISPQALFWKQITIAGSTMGSPGEFVEMLGFVERHQLRPAVDSIRPLAEADAAFDRMAAGEQSGKLVLQIA